MTKYSDENFVNYKTDKLANFLKEINEKNELEQIINEAFENKQNISENSDKKILNAINETIELTDKGTIRVAEKINNQWSVNQWVKKQFY